MYKLYSEVTWGKYDFAWFATQNESLWAGGLPDLFSAAPS